VQSENESLELLQPAPQERLQGWLDEFYGKRVQIVERELLRHRDLSMVERLTIQDALPSSLIYKLVLPPWDVEQDLHERVLIPSVSNSATLFLTGRWGPLTALFLEDLGRQSLFSQEVDAEFASSVGKELAKMHRSYSYRIDELMAVNVLRSLLPLDYETFAAELIRELAEWGLTDTSESAEVVELAAQIAGELAGETVSLVHGDMYAENLLVRGRKLFIIDWSWFSMIGVPVMDLASLVSDHFKNGDFRRWKDTVLDAYCFEAGRSPEDVARAIPFAEALSRLLFLSWLVERRRRGIMGTTVGPVDHLIPQILRELIERKQKLSQSKQ
jgi:Ser/Thr protein kinase RdoA (MazF antagonist)